MSTPAPEPQPQPAPFELPRRGRIAALDYGSVRLGIATADVELRLVFPLENLTRGKAVEDARRLKKIVDEHDIRLWVLGLPVQADGTENVKSREVREFGVWLHRAVGVPIAYFDERFTSREAENLLIGAQIRRSQRKDRRDKLAAAVLLEAFLESEGRNPAAPLE